MTMSMFDFQQACDPFFCDQVTARGNRDGRDFEFQTVACSTSADLLDPDTGAPCGDRSWTVVIRFDDWQESTDPRVSDTIEIDGGTRTRVANVAKNITDREWILNCSERNREVRRGLGC